MITRERILRDADHIQVSAKKADLTYLALTGSINSGNATESSDIDFIFDYDKASFKASKIYDLEDSLAALLGVKVHLISLRSQKPEVLLDMSKNYEVILNERR